MKNRYDIIVIGGGGSGLAAAVSAAERGLDVVVLEKMTVCGGTTGMDVQRIEASLVEAHRSGRLVGKYLAQRQATFLSQTGKVEHGSEDKL